MDIRLSLDTDWDYHVLGRRSFIGLPSAEFVRLSERSKMVLGRSLVLGCISLASLIAAAPQSYADWSGICSCKSEACHGRWELRAESMKGLHDQCTHRTGDHGFLSRVHRVHQQRV
jgi:hypothetical protein